MNSEQQYIELYEQQRDTIVAHGSSMMNAVRDEAFGRFAAKGFPTQKVERYKYTDMQRLFEPNYGVNLNRLTIPADPYKAFSCDVPNLSTSLFFIVNDAFCAGTPPKVSLPQGVNSQVGRRRRRLRDTAAREGVFHSGSTCAMRSTWRAVLSTGM